jgi:hypothetical protein
MPGYTHRWLQFLPTHPLKHMWRLRLCFGVGKPVTDAMVQLHALIAVRIPRCWRFYSSDFDIEQWVAFGKAATIVVIWRIFGKLEAVLESRVAFTTRVLVVFWNYG